MPIREDRVLAWFSCGDASAVAAKLAVERWGGLVEVCYCNTLAFEHPDNRRFLADIGVWLGRPITILASQRYADIYDVFRKTRYLVGNKGARCTVELKKVPRKEYQTPFDLHVFGHTVEEKKRAERFRAENFDALVEFPLIDAGYTKDDCHRIIREAGIEIPAMYKLGYKNNNCIGCVKGGKGYWNKIRRDFPDYFAAMAKLERELGVAICKDEGRHPNGKRWRRRLFLDELAPDAGHYNSEQSVECGVGCGSK